MLYKSVPEQYIGLFSLKTALRAMLDGYAIINVAESLSDGYNGDYIMWSLKDNRFNRYQLKDNSNITIWDLNDAPNKTYELYRFRNTMLPNSVWYSNIDKNEIKELKYSHIYKMGHDGESMYKFIWCIAVFLDVDGKEYSVKFVKNYDMHYYIYGFTIDTNNISFEKQYAAERVRAWTVEIIESQRKRGKRNKLKSLPKALKIIDKFPELFT